MLGSLQTHHQTFNGSQSIDQHQEDYYQEAADHYIYGHGDEQSFGFQASPRHSDHVFTRDSPNYYQVEIDDYQIEDASLQDSCSNYLAEAYTERRSIVLFNRRWHYVKEPRLSVSPNIYIYNPDITPTMRCRLTNWLIEVCIHFRLHRETLYLAIYYIDRYMSLRSAVSRRSLQLLGISALFIAAKLEEIYPPTLKAFSTVCDGCCPAYMIAQTEIDILMALRWHLNVATPFFWLGCYMNLLNPYYDPADLNSISERATALLDLALHTTLFMKFNYSMLASAALYLVCGDPDSLFLATGYKLEDLAVVIAACRQLVLFERHIYFPGPEDEACNKDADFDEVVRHNSTVLEALIEQMKLNRL